MHAEIDPRQANQKKHYRGGDPDDGPGASWFHASGQNRREPSEETATRERVSAGKTKSLRRREIEKWNRPRACEGEFERGVQQRCADHRDREELCFAAPLAQCKPGDNKDRGGG